MERPVLVDLEDPDADHYMCKSCRTPLALKEDCCYIYLFVSVQYTWFTKVINVVKGSNEPSYQFSGKQCFDTYCMKCGDFVGVESIDTTTGEIRPCLYLPKLLKKEGENIVDADIDLPPGYQPAENEGPQPAGLEGHEPVGNEGQELHEPVGDEGDELHEPVGNEGPAAGQENP